MYIHELGNSGREKKVNKTGLTVVAALLNRKATQEQKHMKLQLCNK